MADKDLIIQCEESSKRICRQIIEMTYGTGSARAHLGGSLSIVELLAGLYVGKLGFDLFNPGWEGRDRVVLSKGHAAMALYPAMQEVMSLAS